MSLEQLTYDNLEKISNKIYGFMIIPVLLTLVKINLETKNTNCNRFQKEFFSLLIKQSMLKFNLLLSVLSFMMFAFEQDAWILSTILMVTTIATSIKIMFSMKETVSYLQSVENLTKQKATLIIH